MEQIAFDALPNETGGTLVGYYSKDRRIAYIRRILGVKIGARSNCSWFYRPPDSVDKQLSNLYRRSRGRLHYLGEWHTHPNALPMPSHKDLETLKEIASSPNVAVDTPILVILGGDFPEDIKNCCVLVESSGDYIHGEYTLI